MRIGLFQLNARIGDIDANFNKLKTIITNMKDCDLFVFPELYIQGYMPYDFFSHEDSASLKQIIHSISELLKDDQYVIVGLALDTSSIQSDILDKKIKLADDMLAIHDSKLTNCACLISNSGLIAVQSKQELPDYNVFYESRYFQKHFNATRCVDIKYDNKAVKIGLLVCEDAWIQAGEEQGIKTPLLQMKEQDPDLIICMSASPFEHHKLLRRIQIAKDAVALLETSFIFVNICGANDELVFDGSSFVLDEDGKLQHILPFAEEAELVLDYDVESKKCMSKTLPEFSSEKIPDKLAEHFPIKMPVKQDDVNQRFLQNYFKMPDLDLRLDEIELERAAKIIELGLKDYLLKSELPQKVHLGISGGIDSALTALLAVRALGSEQVIGIILPSKYTSAQSVEDAMDLAKRLGIKTETLSIQDAHSTIERELKAMFESTQNTSTLAEENIQARLRGLLLMAYSNKLSSVLLTTGNKSEVAVGYCTLYGDMCGSLNLIGDLYKTEVYALAHYLNKDFEYIPQSILDKEPSAELREHQKDSDSLPPYPILDTILLQFIEAKRSPRELIVEKLADEETIKKVWKLYVQSEYKRYQAAPIIKLSSHAFGKGRIVPLVHKFDSYL